ncbi:MAG: metallopeptidase TldD-related protein [Burkholderiaceae bacterium]|nr:metallopeptidase TldD-related protein [Burkholderiaceae bacterium]
MSGADFGALFDAVGAAVDRHARAGEAVFAYLRAERSDFVRVNAARVRQAGTIERAVLSIRMFREGRQAQMRCTLAAPRGTGARVREALAALRRAIEPLPIDPFASFEYEPGRSERVAREAAPGPDEVVAAIVDAAADADLVGLYAGGVVARALASNLGHRHYHEAPSASFDFSLHYAAGQASKHTWSAPRWEAAALRSAIAGAREQARILARPAMRIEPGAHRALLAPAALADLVSLLGWGGFSERAFRSGQSPLARAQRAEARFDASFAIVDDLDALDVPRFQSEGFVRPARSVLIEDGRPAQRLVSPRSALEFGVVGNGADDERPSAPCVGPGHLDEAHLLDALGTGIVIPNLWYLNWSDRQACRATGMTRFATLWVENGVAVAPVAPMRFDDSLYRLFGAGLLGLGARVESIPHAETWDGREPGGVRAPWALVDALRFTL